MASKAKRSEVSELRSLLRSPEVQRDPEQYRDVVQKVILYMNLGVDVSQLFSEMIMATATRDLVQKKLVYLYLVAYAPSHLDMALLAVNTLHKDCRDDDPLVRGMALRAICSMRVASLLEYILPPVMAGLKDKNGHVRRTAVLGCVKLFYLDESAVMDNGMPDMLYGMLHDRDPSVVANVVIALEEILASKGGILLTRDIAYVLLNRLGEFNEFSQTNIMRVLLRYQPDDEDELFDILNILDERLKHPNSGVVLAAVRLFLHLTDALPDIQDDVYERIKTPLITLMNSSSAEICFVILQHLHVLLSRKPNALASDFKAFFCRINEPPYVKKKKLEVLRDIADESNYSAIMEELAAYVTDIDEDMARQALKCMARIAITRAYAVERCATLIFAFLELRSQPVTAEAILAMRDLLRRYPERAKAAVPQVVDMAPLSLLEPEPEARSALIWMLGEHGEHLDEAPYILESYVEEVEDEDSAVVRLQLLTAVTKLFFKRPPECQNMLGKLLQYCIDEDMHTDVHDRALLYFRLLRNDVEKAKEVIGGSLPSSDLDVPNPSREEAYNEFNTLSVVYNQPSTEFIAQHAPYSIIGALDPSTQLQQQQDWEGDASTDEAIAGQTVAESNLVGLGQDSTQQSTADVGLDIQLDASRTMAPAEFESMWMGSDISAVVKDVLAAVPTASIGNDVEQLVTRRGIKVMAASPPQNNSIKFFLYAFEQSGTAHLMELNLLLGDRMVDASIKSSEPDRSPVMATYLRKVLSAGGIIDMSLL